MDLFSILTLHVPNLTPDKCKVHLAAHNGEEHPLDVFRKGDFKTWQETQTQKVFERDYIVSLVPLKSDKDSWVFAGLFLTQGVTRSKGSPYWLYSTQEVLGVQEFCGRLIVSHKRKGRAVSRLGESLVGDLNLSEIRKKPLLLDPFRSYREVLLSKEGLDLIVRQNPEDWVTALSSVKGVYLITDTSNGHLYVGSATSKNSEVSGGFWTRWKDYSKNGHGGNVDLKEVLDQKGLQHASNFQYSILDVAGLGEPDSNILEREIFWKRVLCSRKFGYNRN